jgi:sigma-B regulation protein RsbU (phosphoserine phosphatase)
MVASVFFADYRTGDELSFSLFYLVPISVAAWWSGRGWGLLLAGLAGAGWLTSYLLIGKSYSQTSVLLWNFVAELGIDTIAALVLSDLRAGLERQRTLTAELAEAYRRLDREQLRVGDFQRTLLPAQPPELPGWRIAVHYETSTRAGGDYYDFFPLPGGRLGVLIADASGHGTPAAVLMAMTHVLLHSATEAQAEPDLALARLNGDLANSVTPGQFITAFYAVLDPASGELEYAAAGHNPPYLRRSDGAIELLAEGGGPPLGVIENPRFTVARTRLMPGDTLLLYTDGLTEALGPDSALFGEPGVCSILESAGGTPPDALVERLTQAVRTHRGSAPVSDDLTLVVLQARRGDPC